MFGHNSTARFSVPSVIGEDPNMNGRRCDRSRFSIPGEFTIMVGPNSVDLVEMVLTVTE